MPERLAERRIFGQSRSRQELAGGCTVFMAQPCEIDPERLPVDDAPSAADHHPIDAVGPAQHQSRYWITHSRKAQVIESKERQICLAADRDPANILASKALGGAFCGPAQGIEMGHRGGVIAQPPKHHGVTHTLDQVGVVVRCGTIDAKTNNRAGGLQLLGSA